MVNKEFVINPGLEVLKTSEKVIFQLPFYGLELSSNFILLDLLQFFRSSQTLSEFQQETGANSTVSDFLVKYSLILPKGSASILARGIITPVSRAIGQGINWQETSLISSGKPCILGVPVDTANVDPRSPSHGPFVIRSYLQGHIPFELYDLGDVQCFGDEGPTAWHARLSTVIEKLQHQKAFPIVLGGDHTVSLPILYCAQRFYNNFGVIHLDAHSDRVQFPALDMLSPLSHANVMAHSLKIKNLNYLLQIGIRDGWGFGNAGQKPFVFDDSRVKVIPAHSATIEAVEIAISRLPSNMPCHLSIDIDVIDPAFAPEVTTPRIGGLQPQIVVEVIKNIVTKLNIVSVDIVEVCASEFNRYNRAAHTAASILVELLLSREKKL